MEDYEKKVEETAKAIMKSMITVKKGTMHPPFIKFIAPSDIYIIPMWTDPFGMDMEDVEPVVRACKAIDSHPKKVEAVCKWMSHVMVRGAGQHGHDVRVEFRKNMVKKVQ